MFFIRTKARLTTSSPSRVSWGKLYLSKQCFPEDRCKSPPSPSRTPIAHRYRTLISFRDGFVSKWRCCIVSESLPKLANVKNGFDAMWMVLIAPKRGRSTSLIPFATAYRPTPPILFTLSMCNPNWFGLLRRMTEPATTSNKLQYIYTVQRQSFEYHCMKCMNNQYYVS